MKCIALLKDNSGIFYDQRHILLPNGDKIRMPMSSKLKAMLGRIRVFERLFRLEPRCGAFLSNDILVITFQRQLFILSISREKIIKTIPLRCGWSDILTFCSMSEYGEEVVYLGDYGMNSISDSVNIYKLSSCDCSLQVVYTFPKGTIRHIHNILYDKWRNQFILFTGDEGDKVGIYLADKTFSDVKLWKGGSQQYRAVIGRVIETGLIYATDSVQEDNYLCFLSFEDDSNVRKICSLNGSVIYGCNLKNSLIISTTVEPYPSKKSRLLSLLDNRRGKGIKSNKVTMYSVTDGLYVKEIGVYKKDLWPMRLFQYGCIQYPALQSNMIKTLWCSGIAIQEYDGKVFKINL